MRKYLMTAMAVVTLGGAFSGCGNDVDLSGGSTAEFNIVQNYENAFITRFGQPDSAQTWGFGEPSASTRAVVGQPSVTEEGYTFNAQMAKAWEGVTGTPTFMANYTSWRNSGWNDKFYTVNGSVVNSTISSKLKEEIYKVIVGENESDGLIPEGKNNLQTAQRTGYSIVTKGGPVTLTPIYHNSSSGDKISYYYYPQGSTPDVKNIKKYTIGNMADPATCQGNHNALNSNTYSLVYEDASGNVSYDFPDGYVIDFIVSNTDLGNQKLTIADDIIVAQKDWTGVTNLPWYQFNNNGSAQMVNDGIAVTVNSRGNYWQPQVNVVEGLNLVQGRNYKVVVVAKFPASGQLQINMGEFSNDNNIQYNFHVDATGDFQEVECEFPNYGKNVTNGSGHVLFQCGNFVGTTIIKSVKVIEHTTKTIDNTPEFYGDGNYNTEVHQSTIPLFENVLHWAVNPATTPHAAVFDAQCTDENDQTIDVSLIGFEDWTDLDFNDVIFAVTGTKQTDDPPVIIEVPDPDPGTFVCRIIAEDLTVGENSDFDFNDVVFDVFCDGSKTTIRLRAAGGELPLYVAGHEVHKEFGYSGSYPIINTGWDGAIDYENRYVDFPIDGVYNSREAVNNIPVVVTKRGENKELTDILLTARTGKVASKVCVGRDYEWCSERLDIDKKFRKKDGTKLFQQYVVRNFGDDWNAGTAWYQFRGK